MTPKELETEDDVVVYRPPSAGGALDKTDVTVRPDWMGLPWVRPFWAGPWPGTGEARPLHACGLVKKELERLEKPNRNCNYRKE